MKSNKHQYVKRNKSPLVVILKERSIFFYYRKKTKDLNSKRRTTI